MGVKIRRHGDTAMAEKEWKTIGKKDRKNLGLKKKSFVKEFKGELYEIRRKKYKM